MRISPTQITIFLVICILFDITVESSENICPVCERHRYFSEWLFIIKVINGTAEDPNGAESAVCNGVYVSPWHGLITKQCYGKDKVFRRIYFITYLLAYT